MRLILLKILHKGNTMKKSLFFIFYCGLVSCSSLAPVIPNPNTQIPVTWGDKVQNNIDRLNWKQLFPYSPILTDIDLSLKFNKDILKSSLLAIKAHQLIGTIKGYTSSSASLNGLYSGPINDCCIYTNNAFGLLDLTFDIDLWGRINSSVNSISAQADASSIEIEDVQNAIIVEVIRSHLIIARLNEYQKIVNNMEVILNSLENQSRLRTDAGLPNSSDLSRVLLKKSDLQSIKTQIEQQRYNAINALNILTSYQRKEGNYIESIDGIIPTELSIPKNISSTILLNRTDVRIASKKIESANYDIGVAKTNRLPQISIPFNIIFGSHKTLWEVLPSISQVLFDGGKLKSIEDATIVQRDITIVEYEITVQKAFRDVANGISNTELMSKKISILDESTKISRQAFDRSLARNKAGYESLSDVIDRYEELFKALSQYNDAKYERINNVISLFAAIGTGF